MFPPAGGVEGAGERAGVAADAGPELGGDGNAGMPNIVRFSGALAGAGVGAALGGRCTSGITTVGTSSLTGVTTPCATS